jgi:hypothetical protein
VKEELSADEPAAEPIAHTPEVKQEQKRQVLSGTRANTTMGIVYQKMFNK